MSNKSFVITDILTEAEIEQAMGIYRKLKDTGRFASTLDEQLISPIIGRISQKLGQEMDSRYVAYAVEHVFNQAGVE